MKNLENKDNIENQENIETTFIKLHETKKEEDVEDVALDAKFLLPES